MQYIPQILMALAGLTVAACESSVYSVTQDRLFAPARAHFAAGSKNLRTVIRGNPFDSPQELVNDLVIDEMRRGMRRVDTALMRRPMFTVDAADGDAMAADSRPDYWVTLAFNPAAEVDAAALCADSESATAMAATPPAGSIEVRMVFCFDGRVLSTSHGALAGVTDPNDPHFRGMVAAMTRELFPSRNFLDAFQGSMI